MRIGIKGKVDFAQGGCLMSEMINNREYRDMETTERLKKLNSIFLDLYNGKSVEEINHFLDKEIGKVSVDEIAQLSRMQGEFIEAHGLTKEEITRLSSLHTQLLKDRTIEEERPSNPQNEPGHPIHTFCLENRAIEKLIQTKLKPLIEGFEEDDSIEARHRLLGSLNLLLDLDKHYTRKEQLVFPYLEKYGINGPSINMWRLDDFIRDGLKDAKRKLSDNHGDKGTVVGILNEQIQQIQAMIYREEHILFPMAMNHLTEDEWAKIAHESDEIGFCLVDEVAEWNPHRDHLDESAISAGYIKLETGVLSLKQLELILNHLPVDITFIDHNDIVRYFSHGKERIFARTKAVIGRTVQNCHPPKSAHIVEALLDDFKSGKKDSEEFWIKFKDKYVFIRYFAVRDEEGAYVGTLEFTQNIDPIQAIQGEKRIMSM
jgi:uncharacterized protein